MSSHTCNQSSNLSGNLNVRSLTSSGARILMSHPISGFSGGRQSGYVGDDGVTAGDVVRYNPIAYHATDNPSGGKYIKAQANAAENAEVVGVVESISDDNVYTVLSGQINFPSVRLIKAVHEQDFIDNTEGGVEGATGGRDIYFLSEVTAGAVQTLAPITPTHIAKPILQQAADDIFNAHVVNYIGYQIGGEVVVTSDEETPPLSSTTIIHFGASSTYEPPRGWFNASLRDQFVPITKNARSYNVYTGDLYTKYSNIVENKFGNEWMLDFNTTPASSWENLTIYQKNVKGTTTWSAKIVKVETINNRIFATGVNINYPNPDVNKTFYVQRGNQLTATKTEMTAVAVPQMTPQVTTSYANDISGGSVSATKIELLSLTPDSGLHTATVPSKLTIPELEITGDNGLKINDTSASFTNISDTLKQLIIQVETNQKNIEGIGYTNNLSTYYNAK